MIPPLWRRTAALLLPVALVAAVLTVASVSSSPDRAQAASAAGFQAGDIINDATFYNTSTMSAAQIQSFLASKVVNCASGRTCLKDYSQTTGSKPADAYCSGYSGRAGESAATILYRVGQACGINPQVLIVSLQKEQGLVQSSGPSASAFTIAMGYACPDTAACDTQYYGFFNQVYAAARQLQVYAKNPNSFRYRAGYTNVIQYSPNASCGTKSVYIANQATASLYNYTPYTPNAAALAAGYGSAPCGAYGNRNFYLYFSDYFGNPSDWLQSASFEGGSTTGWQYLSGASATPTSDAAVAKDGNYYLTASTTTSGGRILQSVTRNSTASEMATASIWVRAATGTFTGRLTAWGIAGQSNEPKTQAFTVGTIWTKVTAAIPFTTSHTGARLELNLVTTGAKLFVDDGSLGFGAAPPKQNILVNPSFDQGIAPWNGGNGAMNKTTYSDRRFVLDGSTFGAVNTAVSGRSIAQGVPIPTVANQQYTFSMYVRTSDSVHPYIGNMALWALGGRNSAVGTTKFSAVNKNWTKVTASVNTGTTGATRLKAEIYLGTLKTTMWLDKGSLSLNQLNQGSFEGSTGTWARASAVRWAVYSGTGLPDGTRYLQTNSVTAGSSITQDLKIQPLSGSTYTAAIWVKSATTTPAKGRLALWSFGATAKAASTAFTTSGTWTRVEVAIPITTSDVSGLRIEVYEDSVGVNMNLDSAQVY